MYCTKLKGEISLDAPWFPFTPSLVTTLWTWRLVMPPLSCQGSSPLHYKNQISYKLYHFSCFLKSRPLQMYVKKDTETKSSAQGTRLLFLSWWKIHVHQIREFGSGPNHRNCHGLSTILSTLLYEENNIESTADLLSISMFWIGSIITFLAMHITVVY